MNLEDKSKILSDFVEYKKTKKQILNLLIETYGFNKTTFEVKNLLKKHYFNKKERFEEILK